MKIKINTEVFVIMGKTRKGMSYSEFMFEYNKAASDPNNICFSAKEFLEKIKKIEDGPL